jgi:hypothetical protein
MSVLMIGATEREQIAEMIAWAKAHPISFEQLRAGIIDAEDKKTVLHLQDRVPGYTRPARSGQILFPGNFHAAYSCEEQPAGFCAHLSISVVGRARKGMMPHPEAVRMIAEEFGMPYTSDKSWIEEFAPGEFAINLIHVYQPRGGGRA